MFAIRSVLLLVLLVLGQMVQGQEVYRWRDVGGQWHYADAPPAGTAAERVELAQEPGQAPGLSTGEHHARWAKILADPAGEAEAGRRLKAKAAARRAETRERAARERRCARYAEALDRQASRERAGYSAARGMRLAERHRELREAQWRECR